MTKYQSCLTQTLQAMRAGHWEAAEAMARKAIGAAMEAKDRRAAGKALFVWQRVAYAAASLRAGA